MKGMSETEVLAFLGHCEAVDAGWPPKTPCTLPMWKPPDCSTMTDAQNLVDPLRRKPQRGCGVAGSVVAAWLRDCIQGNYVVSAGTFAPRMLRVLLVHKSISSWPQHWVPTERLALPKLTDHVGNVLTVTNTAQRDEAGWSETLPVVT